MNLAVRDFTPSDYADLVRIGNSLQEDDHRTVEEVRSYDEGRDPHHFWTRFVAELEGRTVGIGGFGHTPVTSHPRKFHFDIIVDRAARRRGVGSTLYERILRAVSPHDPLLLRGAAREDHADGVRFLESRGFREEWRTWESRLDLGSFDATPFLRYEQSVRDHGFETRTLAEMEGDPERERKLYEIYCLLDADGPWPDRYDPVSFQSFERNVLGAPGFLPDACFVAFHRGNYVGYHDLSRSGVGRELRTGLTGVIPEFRRRGIAFALKLTGIRYAIEHGYVGIRTWNLSKNRGMLAINESLGFVKKPAWVGFAKEMNGGGRPGRS